MDQHQTEGLNNDVNLGDDITKNSTSNNLQNGTNSSTNAPGRNTTGLMQQQIQQQQTQHSRTIHQQNPPTNMNEKNPSSNPKSPPTGHHGGASNSGSGGNEPQSHQYGNEPGLMHYQSPPMPQHTGATVIGAGIEHPNKDDPYSQTNPGAPHPYSRYHSDPNAGPPDPYGRYGHAVAMQGCKPTPMMSANRPPQRYIPGQPPQGPTPTLNSLLQSHPPPHQTHRYPNSYDPQQQSALQQAPSQPYGQQQGWAPPPRPFSPQLGPAQSYRSTPPASSRGQSPYPPTGQNPNSYPPSPQQGGPPPPPNQCPPVTSQYSPYPQRYPTPPGPAGGPNHRSAYSSAHQYPDQNRPWPGGAGGPSPAASPGPGGHPHPPSSPHQTQTHGGPPPSSPGHAPSPSPQPPQASPSPHQYPSRPSQASTPNTNESESAGELTGQNSNDSSCGAVSNVGSGPPGTPNQQTLRPTPSPTSSSGSRSMSPAVGQQNLPLPPRGSSSQSQPGMTQMPPSPMGLISNSNSLANAQHHPHHQPPHLQPQPHHQQQAQQQQQQQQQPSDPPPGPGSRPPPPNINSQINPQQPQPQQHQQHPSPHPQQQGNQTGNNMTAQGSYQTAPPTISHMHGYKIGASPGQNPGPTPPNMPPYRPQSQQYSQDNYTSRPQYGSAYGATPPTGQPPPVNNVPPGPGQYAGRPLPNHVGGPHSQFPPYQQNWAPSSPQTQAAMMSNHVQGKGTPPPSQAVINSPRPLNYLKQHLQHKGGYIGAPSPTPPQGFGNGPTMHPPMGPPHHMGPPMGPSSMGPPTSTPQNNPPSSVVPAPSANCLSDNNSNSQDITSVSQDNGISSSGSSTTSSHPVTSVVTTGPDGAPLDEASQQSTLSNASAASGEDPQCVTPKSRKNEPYNQSHLAPPSASPGAHPHGEEFEMTSPTTWPRAAASPVFNSHVPQETYRSSKKSDSLCKLYDMDDNPDRRGWLDKLLSFMEERRTPITACPTISKQPLDLYRLYMLVKERGGFVEVTKSKTWKDIAGLLGIGASSSAAYTLRKHYTKNLLAFECHFDRGGIDPGPIIQQVEAGSKKKSTKTTSVPSPAGSSNSQDSFPPPGSAGSSMDGYPGYPSNYPPGAPTDYTSPQQIPRPPSQNNAQAPHAGNASSSNTENINVSNPFDDPVAASRGPYQQGTTYPPATPRPQGAPPYQGQTGYNQYGTPEQYGPTAGPPGQYPQSQSQFPPPNRTMYPPFGPEGETNTPPTSSSYGTYPPPTRPYTQPPAATTQSQTSVTVAPTAVSATSVTYPTNQTQPDYYRQPEQNAQPRRHPDFAKDTQAPYPPYGQRSQIYAGAWQSGTNQYRGQYPTQPGPQQWSSGQRPTGPPPPNQPPNQWDPNRYPSVGTSPQSYQPNQQWATATAPGNQSSPVRQPQRTGGKPFSMPPPQSGGPKVATPVQQTFAAVNQIQKRDIVFPSDSIEATTPVLYRRKRLTRNDVCPVDPWRIFMSLRSGLLAESTWALDILNILLFDDTAVHYFGLSHLPGLLNLLLDHFQKNLADMFDSGSDATKHRCSWSRLKVSNSNSDNNSDEIDLGQITNLPNPEERVLLLTTTPNYTMVSRKGIPVRIQSAEDDIFVSDQPKKWDYDEDINYQLGAPIGSDPWTYGHTETHSHDGIIDVFKAEIVDIPFARYLKGSDKKDKLEKDLEEDQEDDNFDIKKDNNSTTDNNQNSKRKYSSKNGLSEPIKRIKLKEESAWSASLRSTKCKEEITEVVDQQQGSLPSTIKNEPLDSDCREVDMELEPPKIINGPPSTESSIRDEKDDLENIKSSAASKSDQSSSNTDNTTAVNENNTNSNDKTIFNPKGTMRDPSSTLKRRRMSDYEDECYTRDESSLYLVNESNDTLARRCICLSNIFRNLTFVPGNETVLAKSPTFLAILGKLLLLNHEHLLRTQKTRNYDREEDTDFGDSCSSLQGENEWWWDYLIQIRENMLVACANIAGHLELSRYEEIITRPVLDGLLHWAVCPSAHGQDPFPSCGPNSALSPQRLALEALCKLCVTDANVDLVIATPPFSRLEKLCSVLTRHLCRNEDQVLREFSVNLLHYLAAADSAMSRTVALQSPCISYLVAFIEQAEQTALGVANQHGINYLRENPDSMGTSLDMLRRAAGTLLHLSRHPDNRALFMQQEQRLLGLVMSHILDQQVALIISRVLFQVSRGIGLTNLTEYKLQQKRHYKRNAMDIHQQQHHQINCSHIENIYAGTVTGSSNNNINNSSCSNSLPRSSSPLNSTQSSSLSSSSTLSTSSLSLSSSTQLPGGSQSLDSGTSDNNANTSANCSDGTESNEMKAGDGNVTNSSSSSSNSNNSSSNVNNNDNNVISNSNNKNNSAGGSNSNIGDDSSSTTTTLTPSGTNNTNTNVSTASEVSGGSNISSSGNITTSITSTATTITTTISSSSSSSSSGSGSGSGSSCANNSSSTGSGNSDETAIAQTNSTLCNSNNSGNRGNNINTSGNNNNNNSSSNNSSSSSNSNSNNSGNNNKGNNLSTTASTNSSNNNNSNNKQPTQTTAAVA